ncbi:trichothecene C-15 hydroxylase [Colletotrichum tofieldiae]|nr:trichothecene C-15 hydroxylase [Colletotrichum tofieldiae]
MPAALSILRGTPHLKVLELHKCYGDIVRIGPNELALSHAEAWKEVCGHLQRGQEENGKDPKYANEEADMSLISASRERHGPLRRLLSHAFSARAMAEQQPLMDRHIDLFMQRLRQNGKGGSKPLDGSKWLEWITFDIVGDLAFGEPFGCIQTATSHPWVEGFFDSMGSIPVIQALNDFPLFTILKPLYFILFLPKRLLEQRRLSQAFAEEHLKKRFSLGSDRPDFVQAMIKSPEKYVLAKLNSEVRSAFEKDAEIDVNNVQHLSFMLAVLKEAMRVHPAVAISLARRTPPGGAQIAGKWVNGGTTLGIWQYAVYHNPSKFLDPDSFIPERWLDDERFEKDEKNLHQPFSYGPRNCLGMNLAYAEMRLILARIIWNFDLELAPESQSWASSQKIFFFWDKPPLWVYFKPREI